VDRKQAEIEAVEVQLGQPEVWGDPDRAKVLKQRRSRLTESIEMAAALSRLLDDARTIAAVGREQEVDPDLANVMQECRDPNRFDSFLI
jgi:protein subunit release factor A